MKYIHVRNIQMYHPGYKDRELQWAKIHIKMAQGDPDCELITDEIDWSRLIRFILLELKAQKPIPLNEDYLTKKGLNLRKRPIALTLLMLQEFLDIVDVPEKECGLEKRREEKKREEGEYTCFEQNTVTEWNSLCERIPILKKIEKVSSERRVNLKKRFLEKMDMALVAAAISDQPFLYTPKGEGQHANWVVTFDWLIKNGTNYVKVLERTYQQANGKSDAFRRAEEQYHASKS